MQTSSRVARKGLAAILAVSTIVWSVSLFAVPFAFATHSNGCLVLSGGTVWLVTNGQRRGFTSAEVFMSHGYNFGQVIAADSGDVALPVGPIMTYANGTLVKGPSDPLVYLVVNGQKRGFTSGSVFTGLGYSFANIQWAPVNTFNDLPTGANIDSTTITGLPMSGPGPQSTTCGSTPGNDGDLSGGAGDITVDGLSTLNTEEVGEGEDDVPVAAFEIEADEESDVEITSIKVELYQADTDLSQDLEDFASEVSVWMDGDEVGRADVEDFSETSDVFSKSISLDNAVIEAGETEEFTLAISALSNLDSADIASDEWWMGVSSMRFMDGEGVTTTESLTLDIDENADDATAGDDEVEREFSFATFATASDIEFQVSLSDNDEVNDAHVIDADATDDTDDVEVLAFTIEIDGDSDVTLDALPVEFTMVATTITDLDDSAIGGFHLLMDGDEVGTASLTDCATDSDCNTVGLTEDFVFEDLDLDLEAGEEYEFLVTVDLPGLDSVLDAGDTILATIDTTQLDQAEFDAEDSQGDALSAGATTGSAVSEASTIYDIAFNFELTDTSGEITTQGENGTTPTDDIATFTLTYEITPFDGDITVDKDCLEPQGDAPDQGTEFTITNGGSNTPTCSTSSTATTNPDDSNAWLIREGETETITLTVATSTVTADHFAKVYLTSINWDDLVTDTAPDLYFTAGLGEDNTSTPEVFINNN